ncbi:ABC transporter permease [bacterium D16-51]|nr:ABC transporter permease [bacterium D16-59]RKI59321.1 ABC transporter permease [bacterium D16-51]
MIKLLNAGFTRLRKNKLFCILTAFSIGLALLVVYSRYSDMRKYGDTIVAEDIMLSYATITGVVIAIFTSLFLGVEYSDGVIRNKIIVGHKRIHIYLSNLAVTTVTSLFSYVLFIAVVSSIGIPLFGAVTIPISKLLMFFGCIFVTVAAYSAIFTFIAMAIQNKAVTAIVSIMLAFGFMMAALTCLNKIQASEYTPSVSMTDGEIVTDKMKNPKYPSELEKEIYQTFLDINPAGQMFQLAGRAAPNLKVLPVYSFGLFVIFTVAGIVLFYKKDLK